MDSSTYRHLFGQITNSCVTYHCNFPCHNLLSVDNLIEVSKDLNSDVPAGEGDFLGSFPCYKRFPYGIQTNFPLFCGSGLVDHARELIERKIDWEKKLKKLRISNISAAIDDVKKLRQKKSVKMSEDLRKYIAHFHDDPEPMFSGNYNWLYTGGCLSYYDCPYGTILINADYAERKAGFNLLKLNEILGGVEHKCFNALKINSPVLQIKCKGQQENVIICVRQKNCLSLFTIQKENPFSEAVKLWRKKVLNTKLLTSVDLKDNCEEVVLTDTNNDIHVFHVEKKRKINCYCARKIASRGILWSQVAFRDETLYWASKGCFAVFDMRDFSAGPKLEYNPTVVGEQCEKICSFVPSSCDSNFVYLATTHSVLQVDLRNGKTVQKWTHMMESSPQFLTSIKDEENELLVLQSQTVGETSGIVNECVSNERNVHFLSRSLPRLLKSINNSQSSARLQGVCLNPFLGKRLNFAVTGMQCLKSDRGGIDLLTTNSSGDVFTNRLKKSGFEEMDEVVERMKMYESHFESCPLQEKTKSEMEFVSMTHLLEKCPKRRLKRKGKPEFWWKREEMYSMESLTFYKDVLASKILNVWAPKEHKEMKDEEEEKDPEKEEEEEEEEDDKSVDDKVRDWMESS